MVEEISERLIPLMSGADGREVLIVRPDLGEASRSAVGPKVAVVKEGIELAGLVRRENSTSRNTWTSNR
jgi:hypothetical protein